MDMTTDEPLDLTIKRMNEVMDEMEKLTRALGAARVSEVSGPQSSPWLPDAATEFRFPSADSASSVPSCAVVLRTSSVGFTSTRSSDVEQAASRRRSPSPCAPRGSRARPSPACRRRARSSGSQTSMSNETWMPAVPLPASVHRLLDDRRDALPIDVLHREDVHAASRATATFSRSSRLRMPTSTVCCRQHFRRRSCRSSRARPARARAAPRAACRARCRSATSPACSCRRARRPRAGRSAGSRVALRPVGRRGDRSGGEAVIAAEHERHRAFVERRRATS